MSATPEYGTPPNNDRDNHNDRGQEAEVVDLAAARARNAAPDTRPDNQADTRPDNSPDTEADIDPDTDEAIEGTIVPAGTGPGTELVDSPEAQKRPGWSLAGMRDAERRPIVPSWVRSRAEFGSNAAWAAGLAGHTVAYHGVRVPKYGARIAVRAPRGAARLVGVYSRWWFDMEGEPVRQSIVRAAVSRPDEARTYERLSAQRDRRVRWRSMVSAMVAGLCLAVLIAALILPAWIVWTTLALAVLALGIYGAPADRPLLDTAVVRTTVTPLTSDQVVEALGRLRIVGIDKALREGDTGRGWFAAPIVRENGTGWRADITLPPGVLASEVVAKREELAAALARPLGCVWPEVNADIHPGRLVLFVADRDMSKSRQAAWPLLKSGRVDLFKPVVIGTDPRGQVVSLTLMFASMIIGSIPRMGKTFTLRLVLLAACLDPRAKVLAFDLKGTGDLSTTEPVAHRYRAGDEDEDIAYGLAAMRELRTELRRRTKVIRDLPRDICPENKVTPDLADRKSLGLEPIVCGVDECQVWFEHAQYGAEFEEICTDLVKRGPAAGITLILATQRPDAKSIPTGISANAVLRFCLKVMDGAKTTWCSVIPCTPPVSPRRCSLAGTGASVTWPVRATTRPLPVPTTSTARPPSRSSPEPGPCEKRPALSPATPWARTSTRRQSAETPCLTTSPPYCPSPPRTPGPRLWPSAWSNCGPTFTPNSPRNSSPQRSSPTASSPASLGHRYRDRRGGEPSRSEAPRHP